MVKCVPLCMVALHVYTFCFSECMEGDIVMTIVANQQFLGPLEVCIHHAWHRVCDSNWTKADATVACKQLELDYEGECIYL